MRGIDPYDLVFDLLLEEGSAMYQLLWTSNSFSQADLKLCLEQNECAVISDTLALAPYGPLEKKVGSLSGYGWTPEFLNKYVNEKNIISIEDGIRRMTSLPAQRLGVKDRGILKENMKADIVVFDTSSIRSTWTVKEPRSYPTGIEHVFVNGRQSISAGKRTSVNNGTVLRAPFA